MRIDELFSRRTGVSVWTKSGDSMTVDHGIDGLGLRTAKVVNKLVKKDDNDA